MGRAVLLGLAGLLLSSCSGDDRGGAGGADGACRIESGGDLFSCIEYDGFGSSAESSCASGGGAWGAPPCPPTAVASCEVRSPGGVGGDAVSRTFYYGPYLTSFGATIDTLSTTCEATMGTFTEY